MPEKLKLVSVCVTMQSKQSFIVRCHGFEFDITVQKYVFFKDGVTCAMAPADCFIKVH